MPAVEAYYAGWPSASSPKFAYAGLRYPPRELLRGREVNEGCAPMSDWTPWVAAAVSHLPVGVFTSPARHDGRTFVLTVASRTVQPLSAVSGSIIAEMLQPYTDVVDDIVTSHLGIERCDSGITVRDLREPRHHLRCAPPDVLWPPPHRSPKQGQRHLQPPCPNSSSTRSARQFDPFSWARFRPVQAKAAGDHPIGRQPSTGGLTRSRNSHRTRREGSREWLQPAW